MNYNILFLWIAFMALVARSGSVSYLTTENGYEQTQVTKRFAYIVFIPIIVFVVTSTWRYWGDYSGYLTIYHSVPTDPLLAWEFIRSQQDCYLFYAFVCLVKALSGGNEMIYRIALALLQSLPLIFLFRQYSTDYVFSIYLILATGLPLGWMLNGVRQLVAAAIIYAATPLIIKQKYIKVACVILIAYLFHQSAIIMLPVVFLAQGKAWSTKTIFALIGAVALTVLFSRHSSAFTSLVENVGYDMNIYMSDDGTHPLRVLVHFVPVLIAFLGRKEISADGSPFVNYFVNMSVLSFGIYLISMVTSGILVGRVPLYTSLYSYILLPYMFNRLYQPSTRELFYLGSIVFYGLFFVVQYGLL